MWTLMPYCTGRAKAASAAHVWVGLAKGPAAGPGYGYCINSAWWAGLAPSLAVRPDGCLLLQGQQEDLSISSRALVPSLKLI